MRKILTLLLTSALTTSVMSAQDLYLMGYENIWDTQASCKFSESNGVYKLHIGKLDKNTIPYGFKIALVNDDHTWASEWGTAEPVKIDSPIKCEAGYDNEGKNNNFFLPSHYNTQNISSLQSSTLIFDKNNLTLTIDPDLYIAGECTNWNNTLNEWVFSNEGNGIHTLEVSSINGNFKIAAGATEAWTVEYGGPSGMSSGKKYNLIPGPGNDMSVTGKFTKIIVDRKDNSITFLSDENNPGNDPINPPSDPVDPSERGPELYLMGEWNNWSPDQEQYHFTQKNICEYVLEIPSLAGEFKVTSPGWKNQFGCDSPIEIGKTYSCVRADNGHNMTLAQGSGTNVTITFDYKNQTIKVDCMPALYLVGDFNNWTPMESYKFSLINGQYVLRTKNFQGEFRIESMDQSVKLGSKGSFGSLDLNEEYDILHGSDTNLNFYGLNNPDNRMLITINPNAGDVATIAPSTINEEDIYSGEVEYYNLQGLKIQNPTNGIYIRKIGKNVDKIIIK